jgi:hypothetical protein
LLTFILGRTDSAFNKVVLRRLFLSRIVSYPVFGTLELNRRIAAMAVR